jgi:hypothetical protein
MTSTNDEVIEEATKTYSRMSLLELLAHENIMEKLLYMGRFDNNLKRLHRALSSEIEIKLH